MEQTPSAKILYLDAEHRRRQAELQQARTQLNAIADAIGIAVKNKNLPEITKLKSSSAPIKLQIQILKQKTREANQRLYDALSFLPNIPTSDVPIGNDSNHNTEIYRFGVPTKTNFTPKQHFEIGEDLKLMDFSTATKISGARFVLLKGAIATLERALGQFMLDLHTKEHGYTEISSPFLVREHSVYGTGNLPKFADDLFHTTNGMWLIPTAETSLTNIVRECILDANDLPLRFTALTPCFRAEAGAAGRDTVGMIRLHQFMKVELVSITSPDNSEEEHKRMLNCAEEVLKRLNLPFRTVTLCTGDMGFSACKTYDIEIWLPGQQAYREISSCSNCSDFQSRRMNAKYRQNKRNQFVHTLNGSGVAVGRALAAVIENYQNEDGSITIPEVLRNYMNCERIS